MSTMDVNSSQTKIECQRSEGLDIPLLDDALMKLLLPSVQSMFKYLTVFNSEDWFLKSSIVNLLKAIMIYATNVRSPAMRHLNVVVKDSRNMRPRNSFDMKQLRLFRYIAISCLLPFLHDAIKYKLSNLEILRQASSGSNCDEVILQRRRAATRQAKILKFILKIASLIVPPMRLYTYVTYLLQIKSTATPSLAMNLSDLTYEGSPTNKHGKDRAINFQYAQRRVFFEEIILTLGLLPIDVWKTLPQNSMVYWKRIKVQLGNILGGKLRRGSELSSGDTGRVDNNAVCPSHEMPCAICNMRPIAIPYETSCGHFYCYTCLRLAASDEINLKCVICGEIINRSSPA